MRILLADDDASYRLLVKNALIKWGYQPVVVSDGTAAWNVFQKDDPPPIAILDWMMPGCNGIELCRRLKARQGKPVYLILLTGNSDKADVILGLQSGADDYITKPFDRVELFARLHAGRRIIQLQQNLAHRVDELEAALTQVKQLRGLLPICCYCKNIRNDQNYWQRVEDYLASNADVRFTHGICPDCYKNVIEAQLPATHVETQEMAGS